MVKEPGASGTQVGATLIARGARRAAEAGVRVSRSMRVRLPTVSIRKPAARIRLAGRPSG